MPMARYLAQAVECRLAANGPMDAAAGATPVIRLLIDPAGEDPGMAEWLHSCLEPMGGAAQAALVPALAANDQAFDLVVLVCPDMAGAAVLLERCARAMPAIPRIVAMATADVEARVALYNAGADAVLDLSWEPELAQARISALWERHLAFAAQHDQDGPDHALAAAGLVPAWGDGQGH